MDAYKHFHELLKRDFGPLLDELSAEEGEGLPPVDAAKVGQDG